MCHMIQGTTMRTSVTMPQRTCSCVQHTLGYHRVNTSHKEFEGGGNSHCAPILSYCIWGLEANILYRWRCSWIPFRTHRLQKGPPGPQANSCSGPRQNESETESKHRERETGRGNREERSRLQLKTTLVLIVQVYEEGLDFGTFLAHSVCGEPAGHFILEIIFCVTLNRLLCIRGEEKQHIWSLNSNHKVVRDKIEHIGKTRVIEEWKVGHSKTATIQRTSTHSLMYITSRVVLGMTIRAKWHWTAGC